MFKFIKPVILAMVTGFFGFKTYTTTKDVIDGTVTDASDEVVDVTPTDGK